MACRYCYARRMYDRFRWNPAVRYDHDWWQSLRRIKAGNKIFVGSTFELFHDSMSDWLHPIFKWVRTFNDLTFIFLTKCPQNLIKFSPFPENCWVGVTATNFTAYLKAIGNLADIKASVKFISFEPLLGRINNATLPSLQASIKERHFDWLIIGACTGTMKEMDNLCLRKPSLEQPDLTPMPYGNRWTAQPRIEWVREIVEAADKAGVKVFLKNNLRPLLVSDDCSKPNYLTEDMFWASEKAQLRQEMPE